jgi:hypothetical protein
MKKVFLSLTCLIGFLANAQTSKELLGKWQLIKWTQHGKEKNIKSTFKTDQVFQLFIENGEFQSLVGDETHKSKWKLSKDNSELTITSTLIIPIKFHIDYFDSEKRIITLDHVGTFEYKKITN